MGGFSKPKLELTEVARQIAAVLLQGILNEKISELSQFGLDPKNDRHRMEILLLGLHALNVSAPHGIADPQKAVMLVSYTLPVIRLFCEIYLGISNTEFDQTYESRVDEYSALAGVPQLNPVHEVGVVFAKHIGTTDAGLMLWASQLFAGYYQQNIDFLKRMDSKMDLIP